MSYSFKGIGELIVTFAVDDDAELTAGIPVKLSDNGTVIECDEGDDFIGIVTSVRGGCAAVQIEGTAEVECSGTAPDVGYVCLAADGEGGVADGTGAGDDDADIGREYLVLAVDDDVLTIML